MRTNRPTLIFSRWTAVRAHCGQYASYRFCGTRLNPNKTHTSFEEQQLKIGKLIQRVEQRVDAAYRETLEPLDTNQYFVHREVHTRTPMVMLLGNHSSGKSTLINSLLGGRNIQTTGVAPTDDGFTVILRGAQDIDEDGPTAVSNPAYGFEGLRDFGQGMFAHFRVKTRVLTPTEGMSTNKSPLLPYNLMLIDTPGMIDTPDADRDLSSPSGTKRSRSVSYDRGYDFLGVVRWFATRCDVVLLMFDPSNPGTTGETLDVLRKSLRGMDHKFIIVFNKVDMFEKAPDFARCYGALCWNLSKVIDRKDLPRIYTMYTDRNERGGAVQHATSQDASTNEAHTVMCRDFQHTRTEVLRDILSAPVRRLDNLLTELDYDARHLHLCLNMLTELRHRHRKMLIRSYTIIVLSALSVPATVAAAYAALGLQTATIAIASASCGIGAMIASFTLLRLKSHAKTIIQNLDGLFEEKYHVQLQGSRAADLREVWSTVRSKLRHAFDTRVHSIGEVRATSTNRLASLHEVSVSEIPELRRIVHEIKRMEGVREATTQPPDSPN